MWLGERAIYIAAAFLSVPRLRVRMRSVEEPANLTGNAYIAHAHKIPVYAISIGKDRQQYLAGNMI